MVYPTLTSHIAVRVTIGHNIIYVCDTISPSYPTLSQKCISMHMNSCLHTHQGMKLHLYAEPMMYAYGCIWTPAFIPNNVWSYIVMPNKRCCTGTVATIGSRHNSKCHIMQCSAMQCNATGSPKPYIIYSKFKYPTLYDGRRK